MRPDAAGGVAGTAAPIRLVEAAIARGVRSGVGALSIQGIAEEAGVSKALVLYHFDDKVALLGAVVRALVARDEAAIADAAGADDVFEGWRRLATDADANARRALLQALLGEEALRLHADAVRGTRLAAATRLAHAMLDRAGVHSRIASPLLGQLVLAQLDGVAAASDTVSAADARDGAIDAFALALLSLGD